MNAFTFNPNDFKLLRAWRRAAPRVDALPGNALPTLVSGRITYRHYGHLPGSVDAGVGSLSAHEGCFRRPALFNRD
jgi:hypothetical protein